MPMMNRFSPTWPSDWTYNYKMILKNPFANSAKLLFTLSLLWAAVLLLIGGWWGYLLINFETILVPQNRAHVIKMITWEGGSFLLLLMLLSLTLLFLFLKDQQKSKALQAFFASLTHELKTPLASMRLQGEVISELLQDKNDPQLQKLLSRLIEDTNKLETQMDKILQLSRIERGGELNLTTVKIVPFIKKVASDTLPDIQLEILCDNNDITIYADEFALQLILKNLMENTKHHAHSEKVIINVKEEDKTVSLLYNDNGTFSGDALKLGTLFYKYNSTKGSGIGLYLSRKLLSKMHGHFQLQLDENRKISFCLSFESAGNEHA